MKFVSKLTDCEIITLTELYKNGSSFRYRQRAHMVLLSAKDYMINELSDIFQIDRDNISKALNRWESNGLVGLQDLPGKGRKEKISAEEQSKILAWVEENTPRSIKKVVQYISEKLNIEICEDTAGNDCVKLLSISVMRQIFKKQNLKLPNWKNSIIKVRFN